MDAAWVDGQGHVPSQVFGTVEDEGVPLARFDLQLNTNHVSDQAGSGTGCIHDGSACHGLARGQSHAGEPIPLSADTNNLVLQVLGTILASLLAKPIEHGAAIEVPLVDQVVTSADDAVDVVERVRGLDLFGRHDRGARPQRCLHCLVGAQGFGKSLVACQVHVAEVVHIDSRNLGVVAHVVLEVAHEVSGKLGDSDV